MSSPADYFYPSSKVILVRHNEGLAVSVVDDHDKREAFFIPVFIPRLITDLGYNTNAPVFVASIIQPHIV